MNNSPLVTVGVVSYNSSETVLDTLNSVFRQTYKNVELIISDDGSTDNTVSKCEDWLKNYSYRFKQTRLIQSSSNKGTTANCNAVLFSSRGKWLKLIAADDVLLEDCIQKCIDFTSSKQSIQWMVGKTLKFVDRIDENHLVHHDTLYNPIRLSHLNGSLEDQRKAIVNYTFIEAPATFFQTDILCELGGFNEKYKLIEDWPIQLKLLNAGYKCYFLDDFIVGYRQSDNSVFNLKSRSFNFGFKQSLFYFERDELFKHHGLRYRINKSLHYFVCLLFEKMGLNNSLSFNKHAFGLLSRLIDFLFRPV